MTSFAKMAVASGARNVSLLSAWRTTSEVRARSGGEFDDWDGLQVALAHQRLEAGLGELACDPLYGDLAAAFQRATAFERVGREEGQVSFQAGRLYGVEAFGEARLRLLRTGQSGNQKQRR